MYSIEAKIYSYDWERSKLVTLDNNVQAKNYLF